MSNLTGGNDEIDNNILNEIEKLQTLKGSGRKDKEHFSIIYFDSAVFNPNDFPLLYNIFNSFNSDRFPNRDTQLILNEFQ